MNVAGQELGEGVLDHQRQRERVADERPEGADVENRHDPGMAVAQGCRVGLGVRLGLSEAVHVKPGSRRGDDDQRHPHQAGVGQVHLVLWQLHGGARHAYDDRERNEQLRDRYAEVAAGGIEPESEALPPHGVEEEMLAIEDEKLAAAEAGRRGARQQDPQLGVVALPGQPAAWDDDGEQQRWDQQQRGADRGPRAPAEPRYGEGVRDPQGRADQVGHGDKLELLGQRELDADVGEVEHDDRPQHPDAEAEVLHEDREDKVLARCALAGALPELVIVRLPTVDPAAPAQGPVHRACLRARAHLV